MSLSDHTYPTSVPEPSEGTPTLDEYHHQSPWSEHWSSSQLRQFLRSPQAAGRDYRNRLEIAVSGNYAREGSLTRPMVLGALIDQLLTEPSLPVHICGGRRDSGFRDRARNLEPDLCVTRPEFEIAERAIASIQDPQTRMAEHAQALLLSNRTVHQYSYRWTDEETGVPLRIRCDGLTTLDRDDDGTYVWPVHASLKCTQKAHPSSWGRELIYANYHVQASLYEMGIAHLWGWRPEMDNDWDEDGRKPWNGVKTYFITFDMSSPSYEVYVHAYGRRSRELGHGLLRKCLRDLAECLGGSRPWQSDFESASFLDTDDYIPSRLRGDRLTGGQDDD